MRRLTAPALVLAAVLLAGCSAAFLDTRDNMTVSEAQASILENINAVNAVPVARMHAKANAAHPTIVLAVDHILIALTRQNPATRIPSQDGQTVRAYLRMTATEMQTYWPDQANRLIALRGKLA